MAEYVAHKTTETWKHSLSLKTQQAETDEIYNVFFT